MSVTSQQRSDFQAAMLYFAATSYAASVLMGAGEIPKDLVAQIWSILEATGAKGGDLVAAIPELKKLLSRDGFPSLETLIAEDGPVADLIFGAQNFGWFAAAGGAALWKRLQMIALAVIAALSGQSLYGAFPLEPGLPSEVLAGNLLQAGSFTAASMGLVGKAMPGRGMKKVIRAVA
jgi:hypothetical protein